MQITLPHELIADLAKESTDSTLQFEWTIDEGEHAGTTIEFVITKKDRGETIFDVEA